MILIPIDQSLPFIYNNFLKKYSQLLTLDNTNILKYGGYYSDVVKNTNIKIISLNTIYFGKYNLNKIIKICIINNGNG